MPSNFFFSIWFLDSNFAKVKSFHPYTFTLTETIYNLSVKQFGSQMSPHLLSGLIGIQIACKDHQTV